MANPSPEHKDLYNRVSQIIEAARGQVARTVNTAMVHAYWLIGREIVEVQQQGQLRAGYGDELIKRLATELTRQFGKGFTTTSLKRMRQFYRTFPEGSRVPPDLGGPKKGAAVRHLSAGTTKSAALRHFSTTTPALFPPVLSWTHYRMLVTVENPDARAFYEVEAVHEGWSVRELERQIASFLFERLAKSRDKVTSDISPLRTNSVQNSNGNASMQSDYCNSLIRILTIVDRESEA